MDVGRAPPPMPPPPPHGPRRRPGRPRVRPWVHRRPIGARRRYRRSHPCKRASVDVYTYHRLSSQTHPADRRRRSCRSVTGCRPRGKSPAGTRKRTFTVRFDNARVCIAPRTCWAAVRGAQCYRRSPGASPFPLVFYSKILLDNYTV